MLITKKYILVLGKGPTLTAEKNIFTNFTENKKKFCLSDGVNNCSFAIVNGAENIKFKAKDSGIAK